MNLTDIGTIRAVCQKYGVVLSKGYGQNFIVNAGICPKIVASSEIDNSYGVLEIGPGLGVLTKELALKAKKVVSIEIDSRLPPLLSETLAEFDNIKVIENDVLKCDLAALIKEEFGDMPVAVCANLPYYITSPIIMKLLCEKLPIKSITVMVQKEAAERLCAAPGTRNAGAVSYAVSYYCRPKLLFSVQPGSFYPPPKVTSAVIRLDIHSACPITVKNEGQMFACIRAAFNQRRKTAANAISAGLGISKAKVQDALETLKLNVLARPEQLNLENYAQLSEIIYAN